MLAAKIILFLLTVPLWPLALSFPAMFWRADKRALPMLDVPADTWPRLSKPGLFMHDWKNLVIEYVRRDVQWWMKFLSLLIVITAVVGLF